MRPPFFIPLVVLLTPSSFWGCTKAVRYSPEEIKDYPPAIQDCIRNGEVAPGMTTQQVRYSWGAPSTVDVLSPSGDGKQREQWIYSRMGVFMDKRLLFVDGKLVDIYPEPKSEVPPEPAQESANASTPENTE